jgi:hypothetical protein
MTTKTRLRVWIALAALDTYGFITAMGNGDTFWAIIDFLAIIVAVSFFYWNLEIYKKEGQS